MNKTMELQNFVSNKFKKQLSKIEKKLNRMDLDKASFVIHYNKGEFLIDVKQIEGEK
tara:strand:+ start:373 stop:543 length:171 start_codon:yes stop_codon:yes gene_type:complete